MQNRNLVILIIILLLLVFCAITLLIGAGGTWFYLRQRGVSKSEMTVTLPPETPILTEEVPRQATETPVSTPPDTETPTPLLPTAEPTPNIDFNGIRFYLDLQLAEGVLPELVPAARGDAEESMPGSVYPEYTQFTLQGYVLRDTFHAPRIYVYPLPEYRTMDRTAGAMADELLLYLRERPTTVDELPFLPLWNAAPLLYARLEYLDFKNGSGLRYLTQFAQDVAPIYNQALIYTYQGITNDQLWYVAAVLPISHPSLPDTSDEAEQEINDPPAYYSQIAEQLSLEDADSFLPSLTLLDALVSSLRVW
ncbi:MAG: hypothetical protein ANABAC_3229 [Anaerolineae bacterium]|jgi:hypothetical protein|nr:MAG: hypothetical protein ANABAC_3229 [Anaerolineae bacterium]